MDKDVSRPHSELVETIKAGLLESGATDPQRVLFATAALGDLIEQFEALLFTAERLFQMIPREVWRDQGGDDGQGHYEGDYYAERIEQELVALRSSFPATEPQP